MKKLILILVIMTMIICGLVSGCAPPEKEDDFCFIATAAYGSPAAGEIDTLRQFRDEFLLQNPPGKAFVAVYYAVSPPIASFISEHDLLRVAVREGLVDHVVAVVGLTERWWGD